MRAGFNWGKPLYALDSGNQEVVEWVEGLVRKVLAWGYDYLKLDFLYAAALPGAEGEARYRMAMTRLREAAKEAYLLFCGAPVLASLGLADGLRIGPDVAPYWDNEDRSFWLADPTGPGLRNAFRSTLHRLWLMENVHVDPDVVYFRTRFNLLSPEEMRLQEPWPTSPASRLLPIRLMAPSGGEGAPRGLPRPGGPGAAPWPLPV